MDEHRKEPKLAKWLQRVQIEEQSVLSEYYQAKIYASMIPDEIIYNVHDNSLRKLDVALILADISGFTELSERYSKTGAGGPSRITLVLNSYIGNMVQEILTHKGDILKFSGDALLAMWKCTDNISMQDIVHESIDTTIDIQEKFGAFQTDVGVTLQVKLSVAAGRAYFTSIGTESMKHYIIIGQAVWDVKTSQNKCESGEIIASHSSWEYVNPDDYLHEAMKDSRHIKIKGIGTTWNNIHKINIYGRDDEDSNSDITNDLHNYSMKLLDNEDSLRKNITFESISKLRGISIIDYESITSYDRTSFKVIPSDYTIRRTVKEAADKNMINELRPYVLKPVVKCVELGEPLEYLIEMRQVVIMFVNLVTNRLPVEELAPIVDQSFQIICTHVEEYSGIVNKANLFDKDTMFLIVFGLRGFKQDLESQAALRCSTKIYSALIEIKGVEVVSIGVTTGMTYCGVVGHNMRREYTVIGMPVNKAARLMMAYPSQITCDRETSIYSKLEETNFIEQKSRPLKGITTIGPVYEFKEQVLDDKDIQQALYQYPLLGRERELKIFQDILNDIIISKRDANYHTPLKNAIVVMGILRQGKSRILDEMMNLAGSQAQIHMFELSTKDSKVPYYTVQKIFERPMNMLITSPSKEKEELIISTMKRLSTPEYLCSLNEIFNINYKLTSEYLKNTEEDRNEIRRCMLSRLFKRCLTNIWVIGIDNSEFIDEESWKILIYLLSKTNLALIVMTIYEHAPISDVAKTFIKNDKVEIIHLSEIDQLYHDALACQILNVYAIPQQLLKVIQDSSLGNPGWIESFLMSQIQKNNLIISNISKQGLESGNFVMPSPDLIRRLDKTDKEDYKRKAHKETTDNIGSSTFKVAHNTSFPLVRFKEKRKTEDRKIFPVCLLSPTFSVDVIRENGTIYAIFMKTFDSLTSFEQLVLKISSVLSEPFTRSMLIGIMAEPLIRETAIAVKKLFEVRILTCSHADFTFSNNIMLLQSRVTNPTIDGTANCQCIGNEIDRSCEDLPPYASCGYMSFRVRMHKNTVYELLTETQKKHFHGRAVKFLENETKRCRSCGASLFSRLLGYREEDLQAEETFNKSGHEEIARVIHSGDSPETNAMEYSREEIKDVIENVPVNMDLSGADPVQMNPPAVIINSSSIITSLEFIPNRRIMCGLIPIPGTSTTRSVISISKSFSSVNFKNCMCSYILLNMYSQLAEHCKGAGYEDKAMDTLLEYTQICITVHNLPQAMELIEEAQVILDAHQKNRGDSLEEEEEEEPNKIATWKIPYIRGKIYALSGHVRLELGQFEVANEMLGLAMRQYGNPFPTSRFLIRIKARYEMCKLILKLENFPNALIGRARGHTAVFADQQSECLSLMSKLFKKSQQWDSARLAAAWSLNKSLESYSNFFGLCTAYSSMIDVAFHDGNQYVSWCLENTALKLCHRKRLTVDSQELKSVAYLYVSIFMSRFIRGEVERACNLGYKTLRLCTTTHATSLKLNLLPHLVQSMIYHKHLEKAVVLLHELAHVAKEDTDRSGMTWYYALCLDFQLNTGYTVETFAQCEQFFLKEEEVMIEIRDPEAKMRLFTTMWLWWIRNSDIQTALAWESRIDLNSQMTLDYHLSNIFTTLYLIEGLLVKLVYKIDIRDIQMITYCHEKINLMFKVLKRMVSTAKVGVPRYTILKAYYGQIRYRDQSYIKLLRESRELAGKQGNMVDVMWSEHIEKSWSGSLSPLLAETWVEHCKPDNILDWHQLNYDVVRTAMFSLPLPKYS